MKKIIFDEHDWAYLWREMRKIEGPVEVDFKPLSARRSDAQNRLLHAWIGEIRPHWYDATGEAYPVEVWKEFLKGRLGSYETHRLPDGSTSQRPKSTARYKVGEMADFLTAIQVWALDTMELSLECRDPLDRLALFGEKVKKTA